MTFYLFFHPYSIYTYKLLEYQGNLSTFLEMKRYIFAKLKSLPNVKLYDFGADSKISTNLTNYRDIGHYSIELSNFITDHLAKDTYLVSEKNVDMLLSRLALDVGRYEKESLNNISYQ